MSNGPNSQNDAAFYIITDQYALRKIYHIFHIGSW
jgi:hypothetical protein